VANLSLSSPVANEFLIKVKEELVSKYVMCICTT
jgi:hypothetical protein